MATVLFFHLIVPPIPAPADEFIVTSPDGSWRIEAKSPYHSGPNASFTKLPFVYSLIEVKSGKVLWSRNQEPSMDARAARPAEGFPSRVFLDDACRVVVLTDDRKVVLLEPSKGEKVFQDHLPPIAGEDGERYGELFGAGLWGPMTRGYFLSTDPTHSGSPDYFVVRLYWGKRFYFDLKSRRFADVARVSKALAAAAEAEERRWTVAAIAHFRAAGVPKADPFDVQNEQGEFHAALWL
ncbi:MAG: hypothetical protein K8T20_12945, partial [Planctomycetes bacterium]|nr:hypothetical protein [Planctomycetota bacterium]